MKICDTHCDTLCRIADEGGNLYKNKFHVSIEKMQGYNSFLQFFACFIHPAFECTARERFNKLADVYFKNIKKYGNMIRHCCSYNDVLDAYSENKISSFLTIENACFVNNEDDIINLRETGVRVMSLVWDNDNYLACGAATDNDTGLTETGKEIIKIMQRHGIFVDVSHLSDRSFEDLTGIYNKPVFATHSNSRTICDVKRNLTDEQFRFICKSGGYVGINLYPFFLTGCKSAHITDIIRHIDYFLSLGGENNIGLGLDFDGVDYLPDDVFGIENIYDIFNEMLKNGYNSELIDKIAHKNLESKLKFF